MTTTAYTETDRHEIALSALEDAILEQRLSGGRKDNPNVHEYISIPNNKDEFSQWELYEAVFNALENSRSTY
jgi:hypothetical protein|tara:strand:+ start:242 stop:457 length:216 start_codon:yes stop_codon:yes gene_type:complete